MSDKRLETNCEKLYNVLSERLKNGAHRRMDYTELAQRLNCARSTVSYNVGKLISLGLLGVKNGELFLK